MSFVKPEKCGWRDEQISRRHRLWGVSCPAVDLDFVLLEFNYQEPVALVEYKHIRSKETGWHGGRYEALRKLCDGFHREENGVFIHTPLPFLVARYNPGNWTFIVTPLNRSARLIYARDVNKTISELRFVRYLYWLRKARLSKEDEKIMAGLNNTTM